MEKRTLTIVIVVLIAAIVLFFGGNITGNLSNVSTGRFVCDDSDDSVVVDGKLDDYSHIIKGTVTYSKGRGRSTSKTDFCNEDGLTQVREYYCGDNNVEYIMWVDCETNKCENGACVGCYDSDNGKEIYNKGTAYESNGVTSSIGYDECVSDKEVREYYCDSDKLAYENLTCAGGRTCTDGYCKSTY